MHITISSDISQLADKTMTLSELDVSKTPGKKKKKPEQPGSARSEEEPSVSEASTTKKKKKKPVEGMSSILSVKWGLYFK